MDETLQEMQVSKAASCVNLSLLKYREWRPQSAKFDFSIDSLRVLAQAADAAGATVK